MVDAKPRDGDSDSIQGDGLQLSFTEVFLLFSAFPIGLGLYHYVHPFIAAMAGAIILFIAVMRLLGRRNVVVGGITGFCLATLLCFPVSWIGGLDPIMSCVFVLVVPCAGYIAGGFITELNEDDDL